MDNHKYFAQKDNLKIENEEIEQLVLQCEDSLQQIKFLEVKGEILDSYDELLKCKTDMQKALQMDKIKSIVTLEIFRNFTNFNQIDKEKHDYYDR